MPLLDCSNAELQMLRESIDAKVVSLEAHRLRTADPFVAAAIRADIERHILLRQAVVHAGKPAPRPKPDIRDHFPYDGWFEKKAEYDRQQDADIEGGLVL